MSLTNCGELKIASILFSVLVLGLSAHEITAQTADAAKDRNTTITVGKSFQVGKYRAKAFQVGKTKLGAVQIDDHTTVVFMQPHGTGGGGAGGGESCLSCRLSHIVECANTCTAADIKRDGNCSAVIQQCIDDKCATQCTTKKGSFSIFID